MSAPNPAIQALQFEVDTLCGTLDVVASHMPDGPSRWEIEQAAAASRARALVVADRAARESAGWVTT